MSVTQTDAPVEPPKPIWRGRIHQVAFFLSIPAGITLVVLADGWLATLATAIYAVSLTAVFGASAAYHRGNWSPKALRRMKRLDHSMIFILIAGSYTPIALLVLNQPWNVAILSMAWVGATIGVTLKLAHIDGFRILTSTLYIVLGWIAIIAFPQMVKGMDPLELVLAVAGGLLYTAGAIVFATHRPDPKPTVFGYHEVWHSFMTAAAACHFAMILLLAV